MRAAEAEGFDVVLTTDKNLAFQQSWKDRKVAVVVLGNPHWPVARLHVQSIIAAIFAFCTASAILNAFLNVREAFKAPLAQTLPLLHAPHEHGQHLCDRVPFVTGFGFLTVAPRGIGVCPGPIKTWVINSTCVCIAAIERHEPPGGEIGVDTAILPVMLVRQGVIR
ncbi:MAG: hypothetical protein WAO35_05265 [Terriglobia bacterium]